MYSDKSISIFEKLCKHSIDTENYPGRFTFLQGNKRYIFERDYVEHLDGSITGYIFHIRGSNSVVDKSLFRIGADGNISKGILRNYAIAAKIIKEKK